jgi:hypothetical protein
VTSDARGWVLKNTSMSWQHIIIPAGLKLHGDKLVYMYDWFGCHASQLVKTLINMLLGCTSWRLPSRSLDINIIVNVWARIDSQLSKRSYNKPYIAFKQS